MGKKKTIFSSLVNINTFISLTVEWIVKYKIGQREYEKIIQRNYKHKLFERIEVKVRFDLFRVQYCKV